VKRCEVAFLYGRGCVPCYTIAMVHDRLNDRTFEWKPATMQANYEKYAEAFGPDVIEWDGLLFDGWLPLGAQPSS
jgi:hypothetical protein